MVAATSSRTASVSCTVSTAKSVGAEETLAATVVVAGVRDAVTLASWAKATETTAEAVAAKNERHFMAGWKFNRCSVPVYSRGR